MTHVHGIRPQHKGSEHIDNCDLKWFKVPLDHFSYKIPNESFKIRYFVCMNTRRTRSFFVYFGNEANVLLYLKNAGLMWESADQHGASLVFIEHRYYGQSKPFTTLDKSKMVYLSTSQAMADYAAILTHITSGHEDIPVIGFGGSYGGMIATYFRLKYPHLVDGVIAASAPIWAYFGEGYDQNSFAKIVTRDAQIVSQSCVENARKAWSTMLLMARSSKGRRELSDVVKPCLSLKTYKDVEMLINWMSDAWDYMAMGNFPYKSNYFVDGIGSLPAFPVEKACSFLAESGSGIDLVASMAKAIGVYRNATKQVTCYQYNGKSSSETEDFWNYQYCTEHFMPMERDGIHDMFYPRPFNVSREIQNCKDTWGVEPDLDRGITEFGGKKILYYISNVVFSNGALDPWSAGSVLHIPAWLEKSNNLRTIMIPEGAHHLDLMFSNEKDPISVLHARRVENDMIADWIQQKAEREMSTDREPGRQRSIQ